MSNSPMIIAILVALLALLAMYAIFVPKSTRQFTPDNEAQASGNIMLRLATILGNDIYGALPAAVLAEQAPQRNQSYERVRSLLVRSGNPWGFKPEEFVAFQYISAVIGFIVSWAVFFAANQLMASPWWYLLVPALTALFFYMPKSKYTSFAKDRDLEFKRELPEALDLMVISLAGGRSFPQSLREVLPNMKDGVLKDEFAHMIREIDSGKTLNEVLDDFADRAPNESISTFVRAVQAATEVNAPLVETLESRAAASRQEFFALIHQKTAQLESKMWMYLSPTMLPAVMIVAVAPSVASMAASFAG